MADLADKAQEEQERIDALYLSVRKPQLTPNGACHWCGEDVARGRLFCSDVALPVGDRGCAGDWEREDRLKAQQGRVD